MTHRCYVCKTKKEIERHHRFPRGLGGSDDYSNIVYLCHKHHVQIHKHFTRRNPLEINWIRQLEHMKNRYERKLVLLIENQVNNSQNK